jgi:hypothetical protein
MLMIFSADGKPKSEEAKKAAAAWGVGTVDDLVDSVSDRIAGKKRPSDESWESDNA